MLPREWQQEPTQPQLTMTSYVWDADNSHSQMGCDMPGHKTAMTDPDMGAWQYRYDAAGNPTSQTDARD